MFHHLSRFMLLGLALCLSCAPHKVSPPVSPDFVPSQFSAGGELSVPHSWWTVFENETLNQMIADAELNNTSMRAALARLEAAQATARNNAAQLGPTVDASATVSRSKNQIFGLTQTTNQELLGISAGYELDLWKRLSSRNKAGQLELEAVEEDRQTLALMIASSIATTYYTIVEQQHLKKLIEEQVEINRKFLEVIESRFANGEATAVEVYQQRELTATSLSQVPLIEARLATSELLLSTLMGKAPRRGFVGLDEMPKLGGLPSTGLPADLLNSRADVRAARIRVEAADYRLGAAIADRYPSLRIAAGSSTDEHFSTWLWSLAGSLTGPIFDSGRRKAEVERNRALVRQLLAGYEGTVLDALREVETGLVRESYQRQYIEQLSQQLALAEAAFDAGRSRYLNGVGQYLTVLTELQSVQRIQRTLIEARFDLTTNRISLYQALGGHPLPPGSVTSVTSEPASSVSHQE